MRHYVTITIVQLVTVATAVLIGYTAGSLMGTPLIVNREFSAEQCDEIIVAQNFYTKKDDTVCEIVLEDGSALPQSGVVATFPNVKMPLQGN